MTIRTHVLAAAAAIGSFAAPAAAQYYPQQPAYPQDEQQYQQDPQPQPYAGQPGYRYAQQGYSNQADAAQGPISQIISSLLGNRYDVSERQAVCNAPPRPWPRPQPNMVATAMRARMAMRAMPVLIGPARPASLAIPE